MAEPYPGATAGNPQQDPSLVRGFTNEMLRVDALEMARTLDIYSLHPNTDRDYGRHAVSSMHALAAIEHATFPQDTAADLSQARVFADPEKAAKAAEERAKTEHQPGDIRYVDLKPHLPSVIAATYGEGIDPDTGQPYAVIKIQPEPAEPELENERLTPEQRQQLFMQYQQEVMFPIELTWVSNQPGSITVLHGAGGIDKAIDIVSMPIDQLIRTVNFLRRLAVWSALTRANDETQPDKIRRVAVTLVEKLSPVVDVQFNESRSLREIGNQEP